MSQSLHTAGIARRLCLPFSGTTSISNTAFANVHRDGLFAEGLKTTKSGETRRFGIEPEVMLLLRAMAAEVGRRDWLIDTPSHKSWAVQLRDHLKLAGVERAELFRDDKIRMPIRFRDSRSE